MDTKSERVYEYLKEQILMNHYKPNERIIIREIAKQLGVSDIPVREAMKKLASEGLIEIKTHSGARVTVINLEDLEQIFLIRIELESLAARLAAKNATEEEIAKLEKYIKKMDECYEKNDIHKYGEYNRKFHQTLYKASHAPILVDLIDKLYVRSERSKTIFFLDPQRIKESNKEHLSVLEALKERDGEKAAELIRLQKGVGFRGVLDALRATRSFLGV